MVADTPDLTEYYAVDAAGYLLATLYLTAAQAEGRTDLRLEPPPDPIEGHRRRYQGGKWGQEPIPELPKPTRAQVEVEYLRKVDEFVGAERARHISAIPGQAETYIDKAADADAFLADPAPDPAQHPWVVAEARATGVSPAQAATAIVAQRDAWRWMGIYIEEARIYAKTQIRAAETEEAMQLIYDDLVAKLGNIQ